MAEDSTVPDVDCFGVESEYVEKLDDARPLEKVSKPDPVLVTKVLLAVFRAEEADEENADTEKLGAE